MLYLCTINQQYKIMDKLITLLTEQTLSLKEQYIQKTIEWSNLHFDKIVERSKWNEEKWASYLGVSTRIANPNTVNMQFVTFHTGFYNTKQSKVYSTEQNKIYSLKRLGKDEYIKKSVRDAEFHYKNSIIKLSERISKKGLNQKNLSLKTSHIDVNIETIITDGFTTVRAYTILAYGEVQCPHYRYLVK